MALRMARVMAFGDGQMDGQGDFPGQIGVFWVIVKGRNNLISRHGG